MEGNVCNNSANSSVKRKADLTSGQADMSAFLFLNKNTLFSKYYIKV